MTNLTFLSFWPRNVEANVRCCVCTRTVVANFSTGYWTRTVVACSSEMSSAVGEWLFEVLQVYFVETPFLHVIPGTNSNYKQWNPHTQYYYCGVQADFDFNGKIKQWFFWWNKVLVLVPVLSTRVLHRAAVLHAGVDEETSCLYTLQQQHWIHQTTHAAGEELSQVITVTTPSCPWFFIIIIIIILLCLQMWPVNLNVTLSSSENSPIISVVTAEQLLRHFVHHCDSAVILSPHWRWSVSSVLLPSASS